MVAQDEDALRLDAAARWRLPICQASSARCTGIAGADVVDLFRGRDDLGMPAIVQHQPVAVFQRRRLGQIDQNLVAIGKLDDPAAQMPLVMRENGTYRRADVGRDIGGADKVPARGNLVKSVWMLSFTTGASFSFARDRQGYQL